METLAEGGSRECVSPAMSRIATPEWGKNREMELESPNTVLSKSFGVVELPVVAQPKRQQQQQKPFGAPRTEPRTRSRHTSRLPVSGWAASPSLAVSRQELQVRQGLDSTRPIFEKSRLSVTTPSATVRGSALPPPRKPSAVALAALPDLDYESHALSWSPPMLKARPS